MVCGSRTITDVKWVETQIVNYLKEVYADQEKRFGQGDMDFIVNGPENCHIFSVEQASNG